MLSETLISACDPWITVTMSWLSFRSPVCDPSCGVHRGWDGKGVLVDQVGPFYRVCSAFDSVGAAGGVSRALATEVKVWTDLGKVWMWKAAWEFSLLLKILGIF